MFIQIYLWKTDLLNKRISGSKHHLEHDLQVLLDKATLPASLLGDLHRNSENSSEISKNAAIIPKNQ